MNRIKTFLKNRFALYNLFYDGLIVVGYIVFKWDPARILAFYWLDIFAGALFYIFYMRLTGRLKLPFKLIVSISIATGIMRVYLYMIANVGQFTNHRLGILNEIEYLFKPYYEITFFLVLSAISNISFYRRIYTVAKTDKAIETFVHFNCVLQLLLIPAILLLSTLLYVFTFNTAISILVPFILIRNRVDAWKQKQLVYYTA